MRNIPSVHVNDHYLEVTFKKKWGLKWNIRPLKRSNINHGSLIRMFKFLKNITEEYMEVRGKVLNVHAEASKTRIHLAFIRFSFYCKEIGYKNL